MKRTLGRPSLTEGEIADFRTKVGAEALALYLAEGMDALSIRGLASRVGCSPATIYAHFSGKRHILSYLWGHILDDVGGRIAAALDNICLNDRIGQAARTFLSYWIENPQHFRLVFMASGVERADVASFVHDNRTQAHFDIFRDLVQESASVSDEDAKRRADTLIAGLIGAAMCHITIRDHPWPDPANMADAFAQGATRP